MGNLKAKNMVIEIFIVKYRTFTSLIVILAGTLYYIQCTVTLYLKSFVIYLSLSHHLVLNTNLCTCKEKKTGIVSYDLNIALGLKLYLND